VSSDFKTWLTARATAAGFDACAVTAASGDALQSQHLQEFLAAGRHGDMAWMAQNADRRSSPDILWPQARSVVMLAMSYAPATDPRAVLATPQRGAISVYAQGRDYHDVLKGKLKELASAFAAHAGAEVKVFVDTAPLMEKPLAARAGIGWQGRHTNLVSRQHGSWLFLGAILTTAILPPDEPEADHCGSCRRCLDVCPTDAFPAPYQLDARRCIAYLTIEYRGHIAVEFRQPIGNRVFGCDDCLAVCPWNKFAANSRELQLSAREATANPPLHELLALDDAAFRSRFAGTPVKRTGRDRFIRNVLIAAGNAGDRTLIPTVVGLLNDRSPLVRAMAVWALQQLEDPAKLPSAAAAHLARETDPAVRAEWMACSPDGPARPPESA
jgi:epoxyqueuosine reductase